MNEESLRELLSRIHERLNQAGAADPDSRQMLMTVMRDIERALGNNGPTGAVTAANASRLETLAVRLEASHPALAEVVRQFVDLLVKAGI